jgi:hypothetical protein
MGQGLNHFIDKLSEFLALRKGLIPMIGISLVLVNFLLQFIPAAGWLAQSDLFLHLGVVVAIIGIMVAWAL